MKTPARLLMILVLVSLSLVACAGSDLTREAHPTTLTGTVWRAVSVVGRPPVAGREPTMAFAVDQVKGSAGCNSYGGQYRYDPSTGGIAFAELAMTAMGCLEQARMDVEAAFAKAIISVTTASIDPQGRLVLSGPGGEIVLAVDAVGS
jgi:heat shock protein HslJ